MRSYSVTIRPDSVKGKYASFVVRGSLIYWTLALTLIGLITLGLVFYYTVIIPYEMVAARSAEARRVKSSISVMRASINGAKDQLQLFNEEIQRHLMITEKLNFLFGIEDVGGGGYGVKAQGEFDNVINTLDLVEERYTRLDSYMQTLDKLPIRFPIAGEFQFTSGFGPRRSPFSRKVEMHRGIDLAADKGIPILAAGAGEVVSAGRWSDVGNPKYARLGMFVLIRHGDSGYDTIYGHCSRILVKAGDNVVAGQEIAKVGNTGWSTAPHLHFGIIHNDRFVDPKFYLLHFDAELIMESVLQTRNKSLEDSY